MNYRTLLATTFILLAIAMLPIVSAANYYVATDGNDANSGSLAQPFRTVLKGLQTVQNGDTVFIRGGTYRLMDEDINGYTFNRPGATASSFVTIQAYPGETPILLGSRATSTGVWTQWNATTWRTDTTFLAWGPTGMFNGERRVPHKMMWDVDGRMHSNASLLTQNSWTMADANGFRCRQSEPAGCYLYYWPPSGEDPNANAYELSQRHMGRIVTSYFTVRGITFKYTQDSGVYFEGADFVVLENNTFLHNSNGNDNAYGTGIWYGQGSRVSNNYLEDSCYWDPYYGNSHGFTFMNSDVNGASHVVENNTIRNPCGTGVSTKSGVSNVIVRNNDIRNTVVAVVVSNGRCHWTNPSCVVGDPEYFPGGNWTITGNLIRDSSVGIYLWATTVTDPPLASTKILNNVFSNVNFSVEIPYRSYQGQPTLIANNIFTGAKNAIFLNNGGSGTTRSINDFLPLFSANHNLFYGNTKDYCVQIDWGGSYESCIPHTIAQVQSYGKETGSLATNPLFAETTTYTLQPSSPAIGTANATWWNSDLADIGRFPNARNVSAPAPTEICEATGTGRCFYIDPVNGNDANAGTFAAPWKSAENIKSTIYFSYRSPGYVALAPGDFIYIRGTGNLSTILCQGNDNGPNNGCAHLLFMNGISGTASAPITIAAYPGERAYLGNAGIKETVSLPQNQYPSSGTYVAGISVAFSNHIVIRDLTVNNATGEGMSISDSTDITIRNVQVYDTARNEWGGNPAGILFTRVDRSLVENSIFADNFWDPVPSDNFMRGEGVQYFSGNNHTLRNNTFYQTKQGYRSGVAQGHGGCIMYKHAASTATGWFHVYNNTLTNCHDFAIDIATQNAYIHHNLIINATGTGLMSRNVAGTTCQANQLWEYNTVVNSPALTLNPSASAGCTGNLFPALPKNITYRNNLIFDNSASYTWDRSFMSFGIYADDTFYAATRPELTINNNCYYNPNQAINFEFFSQNGGGTNTLGSAYTFATWQAFGFDTNSVNANPLFVNTAAGDYRTQTGSPCSSMGAYGAGTTVQPTSNNPVITVDSTYGGYAITPIDDTTINAAGMEASTWASDDASATNPHWIQLDFPSAIALTNFTVYWAQYNTNYMTSAQVQVQRWDGSTWQTAATMTRTGNVASSSATFTGVAATRYRLYQSANQGNPAYTTVLWITEIDYGTENAPRRAGDLNNDGTVNILDVSLIIANFKRRGNYDTGSDINNDGTVNILDMVLLGRNWG